MRIKSTLLPLVGAMTLAVASHAFAEDVVVKIGVTGPLSGSNAFAGKDNESGVRLGIEEVNAKKMMVAGKTLKFEIQSEDDACDPKAGVIVAQKLMDSGIKIVLGPYCSGVAIPSSKVYDEGGAMQATVGSNPKVTMNGHKNLFRMIAGDDQVGASMAGYAKDTLKAKTVAVVDDRTAFGQGLAEEFIKEADKIGLKVVAREFTTDKATDFNAILTNVKSKAPDVIFFGGYTPQAAPMARQMKQLGMAKVKLLGGDAICTQEMAKLGGDAVTETVYCAQGGAILDKVAGGLEFKAKYKKAFNTDPDAYGASFYDETMMIAQTMVKLGTTTDINKIADTLRNVNYKGIASTYNWDDKGNLKKAPITFYTFKGGALTPLSSNM